MTNTLNANSKTENHLPGLKHREFIISDFHGIAPIAEYLSQYFPNPHSARFGIHEMLLNALEHGNLGMGYETKSTLLRTGEWEAEVLRRQMLPENQHKQVVVICELLPQSTRLCISDDGKGFDWQQYLYADETMLERPHGRGIMLSHKLSFDSITYSHCGSMVTCESFFPDHMPDTFPENDGE